jgi:Ca2+-binding RTX toxin-like protein
MSWTLANVETAGYFTINSKGAIYGTTYADTIYGTSGADRIYAGGGNDSVYGGGGDDTLSGEAGSDRLDGGAGNDFLYGGAGAGQNIGGSGYDTLSYAASSAGVSVNLAWNQGIGGDAQGDTYSGIEKIIGSGFNDTLISDSSFGVNFDGGAGNDGLRGGSGLDVLNGGSGDDWWTWHRHADRRHGPRHLQVELRRRARSDLGLPVRRRQDRVLRRLLGASLLQWRLSRQLRHRRTAAQRNRRVASPV